jgi:exosortase
MASPGIKQMTLKTKMIAFAAIIFFSVLLNLALFRQLLQFSLKNDFSSHVLLIPLMSAGLIFCRRANIYSDIHFSIVGGGIIAIIGATLLTWLNWGSIGLSVSDTLSAKALAIVILWIGLFLLIFGKASSRKAVFPLLFLLFMVPIPEVFLKAIIPVLQRGSAEMTAFLFKLTGTPYFRNDLTFVLPRISIEIASQCSSIRSSLALLITSLLAAHLMLRTVCRKFAFVAFAIPIAMFKNAVRITVLSLLSIHIDTRFLKNSDLHRDGGILFYILALVLMMPILVLLRRSERKTDADGRQQTVAIKA